MSKSIAADTTHVAVFITGGVITGVASDHPIQMLIVNEDADDSVDDELTFDDGLSVTELVQSGEYLVI